MKQQLQIIDKNANINLNDFICNQTNTNAYQNLFTQNNTTFNSNKQISLWMPDRIFYSYNHQTFKLQKNYGYKKFTDILLPKYVFRLKFKYKYKYIKTNAFNNYKNNNGIYYLEDYKKALNYNYLIQREHFLEKLFREICIYTNHNHKKTESIRQQRFCKNTLA